MPRPHIAQWLNRASAAFLYPNEWLFRPTRLFRLRVDLAACQHWPPVTSPNLWHANAIRAWHHHCLEFHCIDHPTLSFLRTGGPPRYGSALWQIRPRTLARPARRHKDV